jgi:uncharacterized protein
MSAEQGDAYAQWMLGKLYLEGKGVGQDYVQAHMLFNLAASNGLTDAIEECDSIVAKLSAV